MRRSSLRLVSCLIASAVLGGCDSAEKERVERRPPLVEAVEARAGTLPLIETVGGVVRAQNQVSVHPEIAATVAEVMVRSGEAVEKGQPLIRLRDDELKEQAIQAEAGVRLAEAAAAEAKARVAELEARVLRSRALAEAELISDQQLEVQEAQLKALEASADLAQAGVEQAQATAAERRSALAKTVVRSPVSGRVGQRRAEVGMRVDPDTLIFVVGSLDQVRVELPLTERLLDHVEEGMPVLIEPRGADDEPIRAQLSRISPFLAEDSFTTIAEVDVDNSQGRLRPGNFVNVRILYGRSQEATLVPASAVWEDPENGRRGSFVIEDAAGLAPPSEAPGEASEEAKTIHFRPVEILAEGDGTMGVEGIREGDWVVVVGQHMLAEQARDRARGEEATAGTAAGEAVNAAARVRPTSWERVQELQGFQREDLLAGFLDKQRKIAAALGAEIPESEDVVDRVLEQANQAAPAGAD